ncbi:hypothetical protein L596_004982 [Steinernema carpocapsae]|uniref:Uncharacterized protein n=1 Tax=Steinernema carpocapsae TaxID=34508 RepID=A0A4U8UXH3_STECR|nr:hypothetical protein L596_004982 [Steinernema carpocapsae]
MATTMSRTNEIVVSLNVGLAFMMTFLGFDMKNLIEEGVIPSIAEQFPGRMDPTPNTTGSKSATPPSRLRRWCLRWLSSGSARGEV